MLKEITSRENSKIKYAVELQSNKGRKEHGQFLAEGIKSLELALKANLVTDIFTVKKLKDIPDSVNQYIVPLDLIEKIAFSKNPEGIVFIANNIVQADTSKMNKIVYLDHINDPGNMGTIIRTALAFNYDGVVLSKDCVSIYNEKVIAASKGAIFLLPIGYQNIHDFDETYHFIVSTLSNESKDLADVKSHEKIVLVLGNEAHGVSEESLKRADELVKIPVNNIDSLNVSVAAGILMYSLK